MSLLKSSIVGVALCSISCLAAEQPNQSEGLSAARKKFEGADYLNPSLSAEVRAKDALSRMTLKEKQHLVSGYKGFFIAPVERLGLRSIFLTDASAGIRIGEQNFTNIDKTIAYPALVALTATWEPELATRYGAAIAAECRAGGPDVLLGPGVNLYRSSENGRNFEYMGEDPQLTGRMAVGHIRGVQSQDIMATAKHFICNNHEWQRHATDVRVDERTMRELYARAWYRIVHEGEVGAVMTSYNIVDGEKAGQSKELIAGLLEQEIGFNGLVMSDWGAIWDKEKAVDCGLDLIMPHGIPRVAPGKKAEMEAKLDPMCEAILTQCFRFGYYEREGKDEAFEAKRAECEKTALDVARRAITLLKNDNNTLPLTTDMKGKVLVTGPSAKVTQHGGYGSGQVKGYDHTHILGELKRILGEENVVFSPGPSEKELKEAAAVVVCLKSWQAEGRDHPFALDEGQEKLVKWVVHCQPRSVVVLNSGGGLRMVDWNDKAGAVVQAYYAGQYGGTAIAEVLTGKVNPSGKLPYTIEREFTDSPAANDRPEGYDRSEGKKAHEIQEPVRVDYNERLYIGYRWHENKEIPELYPFGHGLSYTTFEYSDLKVEPLADRLVISLNVKNAGAQDGAETVQFYYSDLESSVDRPNKELCSFKKIDLKGGKSEVVEVEVPLQDLAFYDVDTKKWKVEAGEYRLQAGSSSADIRGDIAFQIKKDQWFERPVQ